MRDAASAEPIGKTSMTARRIGNILRMSVPDHFIEPSCPLSESPRPKMLSRVILSTAVGHYPLARIQPTPSGMH